MCKDCRNDSAVFLLPNKKKTLIIESSTQTDICIEIQAEYDSKTKSDTAYLSTSLYLLYYI